MSLGELLKQQVINKFRHSYVHYEALLGRLALQQHAAPAAAGGRPALQHFIVHCSGSSGGPRKAAAVQNGKAPGGESDAFLAGLSSEVDRVQLFIAAHLEELWLQLLDHIRQLQSIPEAANLANGGAMSAADALHDVEASLDAFGEELCLIEQFGRQNVMACALLAQMRDQGHIGPGVEVEGAYLACMEACLLGEGRLDPLLVGLSDAYELLRDVQSHVHGTRAKWVPPEQFQRLTRKFWLQPADVTRFKCRVAKHLPILIFGDRCKLTEVDAASSVPCLGKQREVRDSGIVSSVYYDNPDRLNSYHSRLRKEDYATAVRVRWYSERGLHGEQQLFVERKQHRDSWSGFFSSKDRAPMQQRYLPVYMSGRGGPPGMEGDSSKAEFLREVQEYVTENQQVPLLRTVYRRTAFQKSSDNIVRISLDTDLHMVKELGVPRVPGDWCRDMSAPLGPDEVVQFPYGVVEIKLQAKPPQWIKDLVQSGILLPLPRFSKFLHGVGALYQHMAEQLPNWFLPDEADPSLMTPATWEEMADTSDEHLKSAASWLFPASFDAPPPGATPFSFLHRTKTAPPPTGPAPGTSRGVAAATVRAMTEFELACERLPDAEDVQSEGGSAGGSTHGSRAGGGAGATYDQLPAAAAAAGSGSGALPAPGTVARHQTWPMYQSPAGAAGMGSGGGGSFLPASYAALGFAAAGAQAAHTTHSVHAVSDPLLQEHSAGAAAGLGGVGQQSRGQGLLRDSSHSDGSQQHLAGPRPPGRSDESNDSTPVDSAKDLESGKASEEEKLAQQLGLQQRAGATSAFSSQLYKQLGGRGGGGAGSGASPAELGPGADARAKGSNRAAALVRTRVEPKTFFANERTFLSWLQISVLVMMIAFGLLSGSLVNINKGSAGATSTSCADGDKSCLASKLSGAIIAPVALLFMGYSLFMYKKRTIQILRRETVRYDDQRGPVALVSILLIVMITAYVISVIWIF